jgi:Mrp family chromosome partitioning ATPase
VDLDLRRPYLHNFFGLEGHAGVGDLALGNATIDQALVSIPLVEAQGNRSVNGQPVAAGILEVMTAGRMLPRSSDFLASGAVSGILRTLSARGDVVLLDSPPLLAASDASTLSSHADGIVLVVSATRARRQVLVELRRVVDRLPPVQVGCVITGDEGDGGHGYGYGYGYGYGDGGHRKDTEAGRNGASEARAAAPIGDPRLTGGRTPERSPLTSPPDSPS